MNRVLASALFLWALVFAVPSFGQSVQSDELSQLIERIERIERQLGTGADEALQLSSDQPLASVADERSSPQAVFGSNGKIDTRKAILEAAEKELRPLQMARLRLAMALRPVKTQAAIDMVELRLQSEGLMGEDSEIAAAVDWSQVFAIFLELLPTILKLFGL